MTDQELVEACLKKNSSAQKELYDRFAGKMIGVCLRYSQGQDDAQDILQDGFIKVFEKLEQFSGKGALGGWIRMIMINTALIHIRKEKRHAYQEEITDTMELTERYYSVLDQMAADELIAIIQKLPVGYKTVFNLYAIEGFSHREIAEQLGISESTSKTQYFKAKTHLKKSITLMEQTN